VGEPARLLNVAVVSRDVGAIGHVQDLLANTSSIASSEPFLLTDAMRSLDPISSAGFNVVLFDLNSISTDDLANLAETSKNLTTVYPIFLGKFRSHTSFMKIRDIFSNIGPGVMRYDQANLSDITPEKIQDILAGASTFILAKSAEKNLETSIDAIERLPHTTPEDLRSVLRESVDHALESVRKQTALQESLSRVVVPGIPTDRIEHLIDATITQSQRSLDLTSKVNIGVLMVGAGIVIASLGYSIVTGSWTGVGFGAIGMAGVITSLVQNPLRSIGASARRLVQVQIAYLAFMSQLSRLNNQPDALSNLEVSNTVLA